MIQKIKINKKFEIRSLIELATRCFVVCTFINIKIISSRRFLYLTNMVEEYFWGNFLMLFVVQSLFAFLA